MNTNLVCSQNCVAQFGIGVAASAIMSPLVYSVIKTAELGGLIPEVTNPMESHHKIVNHMNDFGLTKFNEEKLKNAVCYYEEFSNQFNSHFNDEEYVSPLVLKMMLAAKAIDEEKLTNKTWHKEFSAEFKDMQIQFPPLFFKLMDLTKMGIIAPIQEEIFFRGLMQDILLTRIPKYMIKKIAPGKETSLDSTAAKAVRIALTAFIFSIAHFTNKGLFSDSYVTAQVIGSFIFGIGLGMIKDSKAGLLGAIGAHMTNNIIIESPILMKC